MVLLGIFWKPSVSLAAAVVSELLSAVCIGMGEASELTDKAIPSATDGIPPGDVPEFVTSASVAGTAAADGCWQSSLAAPSAGCLLPLLRSSVL